ncbi:AMP-binding protein [Cupriavidus sp. TA19]|uniref:class I adenylate-forming enzyme family protein n=1 Tax=unclassified Cupriavidus TaxID=2640874 RepID=UPI000E2ED7B6|nr:MULTISPECIES: AMP-binding protein [unclassified Cupriavidus]BDB30674.1 AMP-binding protein [Cupriavidus sp. P-10]GLC97270.1 AMP-binding protein [Cupriavidus sp. TA19]
MFEDFSTEDSGALRKRIEGAQLPVSVYELLRQTAVRQGESLAWHFIDSDVKKNWREVLDAVDRTAAAFSEVGIGPGTHVAVMAWNCEQFALTWLALARLQAVMVPVNAAYLSREIQYVLDTSDASFLIIEDEFVARLTELTKMPIPVERLFVIGASAPVGACTWSELMRKGTKAALPPIPTDRESVLNLQYTSGTTGFSKACMLTHDYWLVLAFSSAAFFGTELRRFYLGSSLFYMVGQRILLNAMVCGGAVIVPRKAGAKRFMQDVAKFKCDYCALFEMVYKQPPIESDRQNVLKLATIFAFAPDHHRDFELRFNVRGQEYYGMTEIGGAAYVPASELSRMSGSGSCGIAAPFRELRILDALGNECQPGDVGELVVRGRGLLKGYYKNPEATEEAFRNGWFHTGDIARIDQDGYLYILGRMKDMVRRSGENISAREVESVIRSMPEIQDVAVIAVPDSYREEEVKAYIQLYPECSADVVTPEAILAYCAPLLAGYKLPRYIEYRSSLPLTDSQRVQKKVLRQEKPDLRIGAYDAQDKVWR